MFLSAPANPTPTKHIAYLIVSTLLGILLSLIVHAIIESIYLSWAAKNDVTITWHWGCALHPAIQIGLTVFGAIGGFLLGRFWWKWVYVERKWAQGIRERNQPAS